MEYPLTIEGLEGHQLAVTSQGWLTGSKLLIDGQPAPKGPKAGQFIIRKNDGTELVVQIRSASLGLDPVPQVIIEGKTINVAEPLKWYQWAWSAIPLLLLFVGGGLGALCGAIAFSTNARLFRSQQSAAAKYFITAAITIAAIVAYFILAVIAGIVINRAFR